MGIDDKFDKVGNFGFDISPEQLAHDLAIARLGIESELLENKDMWSYYDQYTKFYNSFKAIIQDKTRYDDNFKD
ncbi:hypothetical protein C2I45_15390 [Listeria monocytogenes]|nr:hypothetical protein [Listeria monocytogenes]